MCILQAWAYTNSHSLLRYFATSLHCVGPIGLAALMTAQFYSPSEIIMVDLDDHRLEFAQKLGATAIVNSKSGNATAVNSILDMTGGRGVDVAIEAVGVPATFDICQQIIAPGGKISNVGVHGKSVELKLQN